MAKKRLITFLIALMSLPLVTIKTVYADDIYSDGKVGEARRVPKDNEFKVCADSNNLPYSNDKGEGFENKIAELLAKEMGKELSYQFWFDRFGFLRNTLKPIDVITSLERLQLMMLSIRLSHIIEPGMSGYIEKIGV